MLETPHMSNLTCLGPSGHLRRQQFLRGEGVPIADVCRLEGGRGLRNAVVCNICRRLKWMVPYRGTSILVPLVP